MHLKKLLESGLYNGQLLTCEDFRYSLSVTEEGKISLTNWPIPCQSLAQATLVAYEHILFSYYKGPSGNKIPNPLYFWKYEDGLTGREEKIARLWHIANSSWTKSDFRTCNLCANSRIFSKATLDDVFCLEEFDPARKLIVPRWHFTDLQRIPKRDKSAINHMLAKEVKGLVSEGFNVAIKKQCNEQGHAYLVIEPTLP